MHGMCAMTSHSTAFFSSTLNTASTLLTVLGDFASTVRLSRCTSSLLIASSRL